MKNKKKSNIFIKTIYLLILLSFLISCRKKVIYVKKKKVIPISKEMKNAIRKNETAKLLWKNRSDLDTLKKIISLWEDVLPYISNINIKLYLSESYYLLTLFPNSKDRIKNYKKAKRYAYDILLTYSKRDKELKDRKLKDRKLNNKKKNNKKTIKNNKKKKELEKKEKSSTLHKKYKEVKYFHEGKERNIQNYKIIKLIPEKEYFILYLYTINSILLRVEEDDLLLYRDDLLASIKHLKKIIPREILYQLLTYEAFFKYHLPEFGGGSKSEAKKILEEIKEKELLASYYYLLYFSENKVEDSKKVLEKKWEKSSKNKILYKRIEEFTKKNK